MARRRSMAASGFPFMSRRDHHRQIMFGQLATRRLPLFSSKTSTALTEKRAEPPSSLTTSYWERRTPVVRCGDPSLHCWGLCASLRATTRVACSTVRATSRSSPSNGAIRTCVADHAEVVRGLTTVLCRAAFSSAGRLSTSSDGPAGTSSHLVNPKSERSEIVGVPRPRAWRAWAWSWSTTLRH